MNWQILQTNLERELVFTSWEEESKKFEPLNIPPIAKKRREKRSAEYSRAYRQKLRAKWISLGIIKVRVAA